MGKKASSSPKSVSSIKSKKKVVKTEARSSRSSEDIGLDSKYGALTDQKFYTSLSPMLATLTDKVVTGSEWEFEIKWDGYRAIAFLDHGDVELKSRNDNSFNEKFYPIYQALQTWKVNAVMDGEVVALKADGLPDFGRLQNWRSEADGPLIFYVFDILWLNGKNLQQLSLIDRREILKDLVKGQELIRYSESFSINGEDFLASVHQMGMEGIVAKRKNSKYYPGQRSRDWLKIKASKRHEVVIGGYTVNQDSSKLFSALLVGVFENGKLAYTGKIGTGFTQKVQQEMLKAFKPLNTDECPFEQEPDYNKPSRFNPRPAKARVFWLAPTLVCEVSYAEITSDGIMRHASFEGLRGDKNATEVTREIPITVDDDVKSESTRILRSNVPLKGSASRKTFLNPKDETQVRRIDGHDLKFNNLSKVYWPDVNVTKRDMLNYYYQMAPYILPYLKDRPQSLNRFPNGINGKSFYQKDVTGKVPEWVDTYLYHSNDKVEVDKHFLVPKDEASVLLMASMGCIELNPWSSRVQTPDHPDWCIIDLDPDKNSFDEVITAAQVTYQLLKSIKIPCFCKTSGSTGLHIYIPLGAKYTYEQSKELARTIVTQVHLEIPKFTSIERKVADRSGKMYLDFLQNRPKATLAAPYSLRPKPGATVSMPLHWDEVKSGLKMSDFTIFNAVERVREVGDIFSPVLGKGIEL